MNALRQESVRVQTAPPLPLSCFLITKNEADRIRRTLTAVKDWVTDLVVVDCGSTDHTCDIARELGARVIHHDWEGFGAQKSFAESQCTQDWVLNIDADEVVSPALADEIRALFAAGAPQLPAYALRILDVYPGAEQPRLWADDYVQPRLYDRRSVRFDPSPVHDSLRLEGVRPGRLRGPVLHFSVRSMDDHFHKSLERARYSAAHSRLKSPMALRLRLVTEFPMAFLRYYVWRRHFTGGLTGFQVAVSAAFGRFARIALMLERNRSAAEPDLAQSASALRERRRG
ncbi:MAG: glycosyltransferase family 2 protein [Proteobacteria bacterium]|nr:glycosyltransferase family 2 protein [Pseudomonadota bacterium]